jgi:hypothetical protein
MMAGTGWSREREEIMKFVRTAALLAALVSAPPLAAAIEYKIPGLVDNSGPFADLGKQLIARDAVFKWWNDTTG